MTCAWRAPATRAALSRGGRRRTRLRGDVLCPRHRPPSLHPPGEDVAEPALAGRGARLPRSPGERTYGFPAGAGQKAEFACADQPPCPSGRCPVRETRVLARRFRRWAVAGIIVAAPTARPGDANSHFRLPPLPKTRDPSSQAGESRGAGRQGPGPCLGRSSAAGRGRRGAARARSQARRGGPGRRSLSEHRGTAPAPPGNLAPSSPFVFCWWPCSPCAEPPHMRHAGPSLFVSNR